MFGHSFTWSVNSLPVQRKSAENHAKSIMRQLLSQINEKKSALIEQISG